MGWAFMSPPAPLDVSSAFRATSTGAVVGSLTSGSLRHAATADGSATALVRPQFCAAPDRERTCSISDRSASIDNQVPVEPFGLVTACTPRPTETPLLSPDFTRAEP
jgi:hypothetical protein